MTVPHDLAKAIASLPKDSRVELGGDWVNRSKQSWSFSFRARLSVPPSKHVPEWSGWHLVVTGRPTDREIGIYPDANEGIIATFPHQEFNGDPVEGHPWRTGKPCLERPASVFQREGWAGEPRDFAERLVWHIGRLLLWIDAAAQGRLMINGDPLELPPCPSLDVANLLAFRETTEDLEWWTHSNLNWGFATISEIPGAHATRVVSDFMDPQQRSIKRIPWSSAIPVLGSRVDAIWVKLSTFVVFEPWRMAATWAELSALCLEVSIDLPEIIADAGARLRRIQRPKHAAPVHLLIGFPLEETFGGTPQRFHWLTLKNVQLCRREDVRTGFSGIGAARRSWDIELSKSNRLLQWQKSANWAPDQLRKRGEAEDEVRRKSVLIVGCGTLGAAVAENLLRMGVTRMGLIDSDTVHVGNLSRHVLTMADVGHRKGVQLANRLNMAAPDSNVVTLPFSFPPSGSADIELLKDWDVIVDCTASDAVLRDMAAFPWRTERVFVSLAMTWRANGLFAYAASGVGFPAIDAMQRFTAVSPHPESEGVGTMEGIGCWHPVFPATCDDVNLWAAIGSKFVRRAMLEQKNAASLYLQKEDGSVDRLDA